MVLPERIELSTSPLARAPCISLNHCILAFLADSHDQRRPDRTVNISATDDSNRGKSVESFLLAPALRITQTCVRGSAVFPKPILQPSPPPPRPPTYPPLNNP